MDNWFALIPSTFNSSYGFNIFLDCCDGSDEHDGSVHCPNTCVMGGNIEYMTNSNISTSLDMSSIDAKQTKSGVYMEDLIQKLKGILLFLEKKGVFFSLLYFLCAWKMYIDRHKLGICDSRSEGINYPTGGSHLFCGDFSNFPSPC